MTYNKNMPSYNHLLYNNYNYHFLSEKQYILCFVDVTTFLLPEQFYVLAIIIRSTYWIILPYYKTRPMEKD